MWKKPNITLSPKLKLGVGRGVFKKTLFQFGSIFFLIAAFVLTINAGYLFIFGEKTNTNQKTVSDPQVLGATDTKNLGASEITPYKNYEVKSGETLFNISNRLHMQWTDLAQLNDLKPPFQLKVGQIIKIPVSQ